MKGTRSIVINGRRYDATTGLPLGAAPAVKPATKPSARLASKLTIKPFRKVAPKSTSKAAPRMVSDIGAPASQRSTTVARTAHKKLQHSTTLRRDIIVKPTPTTKPSRTVTHQAGHIARSPMISRFSKPAIVPRPASEAKPESTSPLVAHIQNQQRPKAAKVAPAALSSVELKEKLIRESLARATPNTAKPTKREARVKKPRSRTFKLTRSLAISLSVMLLSGYLTYLNVPSLSVRIAGSQAGVAATYPGYKPDGYSFTGPVNTSAGLVKIKFQSNTSERSHFTISEQASAWNSQAVLDNLVAVKAPSNGYQTNKEAGITIYTYGNNAAWVNGGILYTIEGTAPLSTEQLTKMAVSM